MNTIKENTSNRIADDVRSIFSQYGTGMGVGEHVASTYQAESTKTAWTKATNAMPWIIEHIEFVRFINVIESSMVRAMMKASSTHDVSRRAIEQAAVMAVNVYVAKKAIVQHIYDRHVERRSFDSNVSSKSIKAIGKDFDSEVGARPSFAKAAHVFETYSNITNTVAITPIKENMVKAFAVFVIDYMVSENIITVTDTAAKKNGGINAAHTVNEEVMASAIAASMGVRSDTMMTQVIVGEQFPNVTYKQVTNPRVSIKGDKVVIYNPIASANTEESMKSIVSMIDKSNRVGFVIDREWIASNNAISEDVWATCKPE